MKSTQEWLRELSEASEKLIDAMQREKARRAEVESDLERVKAELAEAKEEVAKAKLEAQEALALLDEFDKVDTQSPSSPNQTDRDAIRIAPEVIDGLVNEIDACLSKLKR